jgi:hypothetical protein
LFFEQSKMAFPLNYRSQSTPGIPSLSYARVLNLGLDAVAGSSQTAATVRRQHAVFVFCRLPFFDTSAMSTTESSRDGALECSQI